MWRKKGKENGRGRRGKGRNRGSREISVNREGIRMTSWTVWPVLPPAGKGRKASRRLESRLGTKVPRPTAC